MEGKGKKKGERGSGQVKGGKMDRKRVVMWTGKVGTYWGGGGVDGKGRKNCAYERRVGRRERA